MIEHMLGTVREATAGQTSLLTAAIDGLRDVDVDTLDDTGPADTVVALHRQQARLTAVVTRLTATADARRVWTDDGSRSCGAWVANRCRLPGGRARDPPISPNPDVDP